LNLQWRIVVLLFVLGCSDLREPIAPGVLTPDLFTHVDLDLAVSRPSGWRFLTPEELRLTREGGAKYFKKEAPFWSVLTRKKRRHNYFLLGAVSLDSKKSFVLMVRRLKTANETTEEYAKSLVSAMSLIDLVVDPVIISNSIRLAGRNFALIEYTQDGIRVAQLIHINDDQGIFFLVQPAEPGVLKTLRASVRRSDDLAPINGADAT